ncbi:hypothetical protein DIPPA_11714 [Diplonema papillatum]|nr:hypothetical protein DIPPA_11714 [Diplonema papillatum]|eukprot:gene8608-13309_t
MPTLEDLRSELATLDDDIAELHALQGVAKKPAVHALLRDGLQKTAANRAAISAQIDRAAPPAPAPAPPRESAAAALENPADAPPAPAGFDPSLFSFKPVKKYAWDQKDKTVSVYCDLPNLKDADLVEPKFGQLDFSVYMVGVPVNPGSEQKENYKLDVPALCHKISAAKSAVLRKDHRLVVRLSKLEPGKEWSGLDDSEDRKKANHEALVSSGADTAELLANMYRNADDETREKLSKAAHEGRLKREQQNKGVFTN